MSLSIAFQQFFDKNYDDGSMALAKFYVAKQSVNQMIRELGPDLNFVVHTLDQIRDKKVAGVPSEVSIFTRIQELYCKYYGRESSSLAGLEKGEEQSRLNGMKEALKKLHGKLTEKERQMIDRIIDEKGLGYHFN